MDYNTSSEQRKHRKTWWLQAEKDMDYKSDRTHFPHTIPKSAGLQRHWEVQLSLLFSHSGFPVLHHLPELAQTHVHWVSDTIQPSRPLSSSSPPAFNFPSIRVFSKQYKLIPRWWSIAHSQSKESTERHGDSRQRKTCVINQTKPIFPT